jgi:hypothetical protein
MAQGFVHCTTTICCDGCWLKRTSLAARDARNPHVYCIVAPHDKLKRGNMNWIAKIPDIFLYPVGWYLVATEWIEKHAHATFWCGVAAVTVVWWL